tara:strand:- start:4879 stop:5550 length:672 start_codon:yes stop_codon:yes gene_type:complete
MKSAIKRIINKDIKSLEDLKKNKIYVEFDENNFLNAKALIIGPDDTIYENGLFFFNIEFPTNYPHTPPVLKYISRSKIRIHPNIYVSGKVCLSILGTWKGPSWTSSMDISCVLLSLQSLLNNEPLSHEPGFEKYSGPISEDYKSIVYYDNILSLFYRNTKYIMDEFIFFQNIIIDNFKNNKEKIINKLKEIENKELNISVNIYRINSKIDYNFLINKLNKFDL